MFKTETHLHTAEVSHCGRLSASEMITKYKEAGYKTVIITDHFQSIPIDLYGDIAWEEKTDKFLAGYYQAKLQGDKIGVNVIMGAEICFTNAPNHYLVYGITKEFLDKYPELHTYGIEKFSKIARENGVLIIQAHPYRDGRCYPTPNFVDGIEIYNSNPRHDDFSDKSAILAKENNLLIIGGSDAHRLEDIALSGIETSEEIKTSKDFIRLVKQGSIKIIGE